MPAHRKINDKAGYQALVDRLSENVKSRRTELCLSQMDVATRANVTFPQVGAWENQRRPLNPCLRTLYQFAHALECTIGELLGELPKHDANGIPLGTHQHRLTQLARKLPPKEARELVQMAEKKLNDYYSKLKLRPPL